jgi:hypothetical protein
MAGLDPATHAEGDGSSFVIAAQAATHDRGGEVWVR